MTASAFHVTTGEPAALPAGPAGPPGPAGAPQPAGVRQPARTPQPGGMPPSAGGPQPGGAPRLAEGVELLGEYQDSGYSQPPSLVRRSDGQVIQMSALLYQITCRIDGARDPAAIAEAVSADIARSLTAEQVSYVITAKLLPLGIVANEAERACQAGQAGQADEVTHGDRPRAALPTASPLLALRMRATLLPERAANAVGALLRPLLRWPAVVAVLAAMAAVDYWLFAIHGLGAGLRDVLRDPADLLVVVALTVVSAMFHECGHATGCRCGGARPGVIGVGLYLVWPSFFTNVTDSYRLSRAGRLRTDLGGLYFNVVFMLAMAGLYVATSAEILLLVIAFTHLEMLEQLLPVVRFDGYYILTDLAGVPDLFARVVPILKSALPAGRQDPRVAGLRRRARVVVTAWVLCVVPLLTGTMGYLLLWLPAINRALWLSASLQGHLMSAAVAGHRFAMAAADAIGTALLMFSLAGSVYIAAGLAGRAFSAGVRWSAGRPGRRLLAAAAGLACLATLAAFWTVQGQFHGW
jgi:putative peptide zinc metalloprotease protein